mmetsp:Transcript_36958/g.57831  ORF Transcript_36958/g.57831 Transcript_36958/m.57831 type:complete len:250 (-) Transcript_36958:1497-2246(-)
MILELNSERSLREAPRHLYFSVHDEAVDYIPAEFRPLSVVVNETRLAATFRVFKSSKNHGDFAHADLLVNRLPSYTNAWVFEEDVKYIGEWHELLDKFLNKPSSDLVVWAADALPMPGKPGTWWWVEKNWFGRWKDPNKRPGYFGIWSMGYRMSRKLADKLYQNLLEGTSNKNQEVNLMTTAKEGLSLHMVAKTAQKKEWVCCQRGNGQQRYNKLMQTRSKCEQRDTLLHPVRFWKQGYRKTPLPKPRR